MNFSAPNILLHQNRLETFNPFTAGVLDGVLRGDCNFCVCGRNPMMWPFKWKLPACTYTWYFLFFKMLENEIWKSGRNLPLTTFGTERVKFEAVDDRMRTRFHLKLALLFLLKEVKTVHLLQNDKTFNFDDLFPLLTTTFSLKFLVAASFWREKVIAV